MIDLRRNLEARFGRMLKRLFGRLAGVIENSRTPEEAIRKLRRIASSSKWQDLCDSMSERMITMLNVGQKRTWREAASASSQGREIYKALMKETSTGAMGQQIAQAVQQNSTLIKTVPSDMAERFSKMAQENYMQGMRPEETMKQIMKEAPHLKEYEARRIARTESAKASTELVRARAESLGLNLYVWHTCNDERVRDSHRAMQGVVCSWSDPPSPERLAGTRDYGPYHPAGIFNCRCIALPVVDPVLDVTYPAKAYKAGRLVTVRSFMALQELYGIETNQGKGVVKKDG